MNYKSKAMQMKFKSAPHCDTKSLMRQVMNVLKCDSQLENMWKHSEGISDYDLAFDGKDGYSVVKRAVLHTKIFDSGRPFLSLIII